MGLLDGASSLGSAGSLVSAGANAANLGSALRSGDLPTAGEIAGDLYAAVAAFKGDPYPNDWRVRLSLAYWPSFQTSPVLQPLKDAGGLVFPYTPQITIASSAKYTSPSTVHTNYNFQAFQHSDPGEISITAPMYVEDPSQGLYWIAAVHYLRSLTKMFSGNDPKAGNPPPVIFLNGYGNFVFKNVPVVVTKMSIQLDASCDYIGVDVVGGLAAQLEGVAEAVADLADTIGGAFPGASDFTSAVSNVAGGAAQAAHLATMFGVGGSTKGGISHVPTKSSIQLTLMPVYSRTSARKFSLDRFVQGGYLNNGTGYI